jgi:hypothetical protein
MNIEKKKVTEIKPYWRNPRNNRNAIDKVKESIKRFGFNNPILIDSSGVIIAGHTRYAAAIQLGHDEVPCITLDLDPKKAKEFRIVDNKTAEFAEWDFSKLVPELRELDLGDMQTFFGDVDLSQLIENSASIQNFEELKQFKIDDTQKELNERYKSIADSGQADQMDINCPECGAEFAIKKADIKTMMGQ